MSAAPAEASARGVAVQVFAYLGGMTAYALHLLGSPPLVPLSCEIGSTWPLHLLTAAMLAVIAVAILVSWRLWRGAVEAPVGPGGAGPDDAAALRVSRRGFLGVSGLMLNVLAFVVVMFAEIPNHFLNPCLP